METYIRPRQVYIGFEATELYRAEEKLHSLIHEIGTLRAAQPGPTTNSFFTGQLPQVLYDLFNSYDKKAIRAAIDAWIEDNPARS